jgi:hypothetical protein
VIYGIAGAKSTKSVVNTVAETMDTTDTSKVASTTSTLKSTGWSSSDYYELTKDGSDASVTTLGTDVESTGTATITGGTAPTIKTSDDTTTTVTHYRHPLVITNRL